MKFSNIAIKGFNVEIIYSQLYGRTCSFLQEEFDWAVRCDENDRTEGVAAIHDWFLELDRWVLHSSRDDSINRGVQGGFGIGAWPWSEGVTSVEQPLCDFGSMLGVYEEFDATRAEGGSFEKVRDDGSSN